MKPHILQLSMLYTISIIYLGFEELISNNAALLQLKYWLWLFSFDLTGNCGRFFLNLHKM